MADDCFKMPPTYKDLVLETLPTRLHDRAYDDAINDLSYQLMNTRT